MECSICLSPIEDDDATSKTTCGHTFHSNCIFTSIAHKNFSCPNCREKLTNVTKEEEDATENLIRSIIAIGTPEVTNDTYNVETSNQFRVSRGENHIRPRILTSIESQILQRNFPVRNSVIFPSPTHGRMEGNLNGLSGIRVGRIGRPHIFPLRPSHPPSPLISGSVYAPINSDLFSLLTRRNDNNIASDISHDNSYDLDY